MKTTLILLSVMSFSPLASYAKDPDNNTGSSCKAYVKSIQVDGLYYRYRLVDLNNNNINGSKDWSFTAGNLNLDNMLNTAYLLKQEICINYTYHSSKWEITNVKI